MRRGRVVDVRERAGSTPIPSDGFVLSARGARRGSGPAEHLRQRTKVKVSAALKPAGRLRPQRPRATREARGACGPTNPWSAAEDVVGGGPKIVTAGRVDITLGREKVLPSFSTTRHPRTAIAPPGNKALLVVVDGRQPALSVGMSLDELARLMIELGAVEAINLDGGGSSTMTIDGKVVNHPSDLTGERPVSDAILVAREAGELAAPDERVRPVESFVESGESVESVERVEALQAAPPTPARRRASTQVDDRCDARPGRPRPRRQLPERRMVGPVRAAGVRPPTRASTWHKLSTSVLPVAPPAREQFRRSADVLGERQHVDGPAARAACGGIGLIVRLARKLAKVARARVDRVGHGLEHDNRPHSRLLDPASAAAPAPPARRRRRPSTGSAFGEFYQQERSQSRPSGDGAAADPAVR